MFYVIFVVSTKQKIRAETQSIKRKGSLSKSLWKTTNLQMQTETERKRNNGEANQLEGKEKDKMEVHSNNHPKCKQIEHTNKKANSDRRDKQTNKQNKTQVSAAYMMPGLIPVLKTQINSK